MRHKHSFPKIPVLICLVILCVIFLQYRTFRSSFVPGKAEISSNFLSGTILENGVPAIDHPKFESVSVADQYLNNDGLGIAVESNHVFRFYPFQILVWHHVVNDLIGSQPLLISYNPFAMSGAVYQRSLQGTVFDFGLSDKMADSNLLLYDRQTHSLWNPMTHQAIEGEKNGTVLARYPSSVMSWNAFKGMHTDGQVLSRDTGFARDYTHDPYGDYDYDAKVLFPVTHKDDRLGAKVLVYGIEWNQKQKAFPIELLKKQNTIHDTMQGTNMSIEYDPKTEIVHAFQLDASGNHQNEIPVTESYWFSWVAAFPTTDLYHL